MSGRLRGNMTLNAVNQGSSSAPTSRQTSPSSLNGTAPAAASSTRHRARSRRASAATQLAASFHPCLITTQIVALQALHYLLLAFLFQLNGLIWGTSVTIDRIFTDHYVRLWHNAGWADAGAIVISSLAGSILMAIIVEKSKKCLDFGVTLFVIHLALSTLYAGIPTVMDWWIVHIGGMIVMVLLGEYLCSLKEMEDIPLLQL